MKDSFKNAQAQSYQPHFEQGFGDNNKHKTQFLPKEFTSSKTKKSQAIDQNIKIEPLHPRLRLTQQEAWANYLEKLNSF